MANLKALISPGIAGALGLASPFLPKISGIPVLAMGAAAIGALITPAKSKGQIILFLFVWVIFFALSASVLGGI